MATCPVCNNLVEEGANSCPLCGFKLFGSTQKFTPVSLDAEEFTPAEAPAAQPSASLRVVRGPQIGMIFSLEDGSKTIGRSPDCDIFLNDMTVSRQHAMLEPSAAGYRIVDNNSYNGLWVNNNAVDQITLQPGDVVQVGTFLLVYEEE